MLALMLTAAITSVPDESADKLENLRVQEVKKLEGSWKVAKTEPSGLKIPDDYRVAFKGEKVTFGKQPPFRFKLDVSKDPKWFDQDIAPLYGEKEKEVFAPGLYKLDGDNLILATVNESQDGVFKPRPKDFKEKFHGQRMHLEREKK